MARKKTVCPTCHGGGHVKIDDPSDSKRKWAVCVRCQGTGGRKSRNPWRFPDGVVIVGYMKPDGTEVLEEGRR